MFHTKASGLGGRGHLKEKRMGRCSGRTGGGGGGIIAFPELCTQIIKQVWGKTKDVFHASSQEIYFPFILLH